MAISTLSSSISEIEYSAPKVFSMREAMKKMIENYFDAHKDVPLENLYDLMIEEIEEPLLKLLMEKFYNQSKVAKALGLSRGTTRKRLLKYGIIGQK
jgi:Fis family transcriptional regulator, factor for inversion stimulation protein